MRWVLGVHLLATFAEPVGQRLIGYELDAEDCIQAVSLNWLEHACLNGAPELKQEAVIGRSLWDFVEGKETRHLSSLLFSAARQRQRPLGFPFRCDSPTYRRFVRLSVVPLLDSALEVSSETVREELRRYVALLDPQVSRSADFLTICSWCKRILLSGNEWVEVEMAIHRLDLFGATLLPQLSHGVCGECASRIDAECGLESDF